MSNAFKVRRVADEKTALHIKDYNLVNVEIVNNLPDIQVLNANFKTGKLTITCLHSTYEIPFGAVIIFQAGAIVDWCSKEEFDSKYEEV